jgi:hypothetical protein
MPRSAVRARLRGAPLATGLALAAGAVAAVSCGGAAAAREVVFVGICDASGAVPLTSRTFAVADDEDNRLRVYDADRGGEPLRLVDLSASLLPPDAAERTGSDGKKKKKKKKDEKKPRSAEPAKEPRPPPESDLEAATRVGDLAFWMTSHGRNRSGKRKDARLLFFATTANGGSDALQLVGKPYGNLLEDLLADARYAGFGLAAASELAPKDPGGLNLEGLGERPDGGVWIGFRNPIPGGRALVAPLLNPERLVEGERARLGDPILLDLGGLGIRSLSRWRGRTLIAAGSFADGGSARLFTWDGRGTPVPVSGLDLEALNPEGFFSPEDREEILLLSDDGGVEIDGKECKRLEDPSHKRFRGRWVRVSGG